MLGSRKIGTSKASEAADKLKAERKVSNSSPEAVFKKNAYIAAGCLVLALVVALGLLFSSLSKNRLLDLQNKTIKAKMVELSQPKYDLAKDFILSQCGDEGVFCKTTQTNNPSLEMLKFLVNFREIPGKQYRLIFEVSLGGDQKAREVLSCDGEFASFYVCQEITSASPTDVIRAFENSYRSLTGEATYTLNLMVKPMGELEYTNPITMKAS